MGNFRRLWIAWTIDSFGTWLLIMATPLEVYRLTGSTTSTGTALAIEALPAVVLGPWAGVAVDRWPRRRILIAANLVAAGGVALMLAGTAPGRIGLLYAALVVESVAVCFLQPAIAALVPALAPDLPAANARMAFTGSVFRLIGPPAGTFLAAHGRFEIVVLVDAASYLVAAAIIGFLRIPAIEPGAVAVRLRAGFRLIRRTPALRGLLIAGFVYWTANAALTVLLIPFATGRLHRGGEVVGWLIAGLGLGYLCGSALSKPTTSRYGGRRVLGWAYGCVGLCFLVLFTTRSLPVALAAVTLSGVPGAVAMVAGRHVVQTGTPGDALGRVSAAFGGADAAAAVAGALLAPAVVGVFGVVGAPVVLSVMVLAAAGLAPGGSDSSSPVIRPGASG
jgi:predicted MFS family arabinose efflux permease